MRTDTLIHEAGLKFGLAFTSDRQFHLSLLAGPIILAMMTAVEPAWAHDVRISAFIILSAILWQPLIEELLFRGVIQGRLLRTSWAQYRMAGLSVANGLTTLLFVLAHLVHHSPSHAAAVAVPSLVFGYFRDRHGQIYPSICLHAAYNALYFLTAATISHT